MITTKNIEVSTKEHKIKEIKEKNTILEYSNENYILKMNPKDSKENSNDNSISFMVQKESKIEKFFFKKILNYEDFKKLGKFFKIYDNIEEIFDYFSDLIENKKIVIKEIDNEKSLTLSMNSKFPGFKNPFSVDIELSKMYWKDEELIDSLYKKINEFEKENQDMKEKIRVLKNENSIIKNNINDQIRNKNSIKYFKFGSTKDSSYHFSNSSNLYNRIVASTTVKLSSYDVLFIFRKKYNYSCSKTFLITKLYYDNNSNKDIIIDASSTEPSYYKIIGASVFDEIYYSGRKKYYREGKKCIYFYNCNDNIIAYNNSDDGFYLENDVKVLTNCFSVDNFTLIDYPS
eukprot:jgi/Orpsp1_1/1189286/evm.model.d7180000070877.1